MLKRYEDNELGESASRRVSYHCTTDYAKSSKAKCRVCKTNIEEDELRLALMLQDDEGYKNTAWTHFNCFWKHPETTKLNGTHEIHNFSKLKPADQKKISTAFDEFNSNKSIGKKKGKRMSNKRQSNDDSSDEDFTVPSKHATRATNKKSSSSNKRKRDSDDG